MVKAMGGWQKLDICSGEANGNVRCSTHGDGWLMSKPLMRKHGNVGLPATVETFIYNAFIQHDMLTRDHCQSFR